jgi:hypothetical protein
MGPAILRAVAGGKEQSNCGSLFILPVAGTFLCKLAKKRSGVVVVGLCIQMILFFPSFSLLDGHISAFAIISKKEHLTP